MKHREISERVGAFQQKLIDLGYPLPRYGADHEFGDETYRAAIACAEDNWPDLTWAEYVESEDELDESVVALIMALPLPTLPDYVVDVRDKHPIKRGRKAPRRILEVDAIVLHQTAPGPHARFLGTDPERWYTLAAHIGIPQDGKVILVNDFNIKMYQANYFNNRSVGVEVDGHFEGVLGDDRTMWRDAPRPAAVLTPEQIEGARNACRFTCDDVARRGGRITTILAHRQTSASREADPGEAIWKSVGLWAQEELGLVNEIEHTKWTGKPIPRQWDPRSNHNFR